MHRFRFLYGPLALTLIAGIAIAVAIVSAEPRQSVAAKRPKPTTFGAVIDPPQSGRLFAEFEEQDAIILGFNELIQFHHQTLVDLVRAINGRVQIIGLISSPDQEQQVRNLLSQHEVSAESIEFFFWPAVSMWVQDYGPLFLVGDEMRVIDFCYGFPDREAEDQTALAFAATYGMKIANSRLTMEGGNLLSNGQGFCVTSSVLIEQNANRGYDFQKIASILKSDFRMNQWSYLLPLEGEATGHVDMYLTFVDPTTVVLGEYAGADDAKNALRLEKNREILASVRLEEDKALKIVRMPMPSRRDGLWRTYTNVIYANGMVLVPQYPDYCPDLDARALEVYRKLLPDWQVVGIDASSIIQKRGSLHCISLNVPFLPKADAQE